MDQNNLIAIAENFMFEGGVMEIKPLGEGFINDTYIVTTKSGNSDYILQRKNHNVFKDVPQMMDNIARVTAHLRAKVVAQGGDPKREVITLIPMLTPLLPKVKIVAIIENIKSRIIEKA